MERTTEVISIRSFDEMPSMNSIRGLPREKALKFVFKRIAREQIEKFGQELKLQLSGFQVLTHTIEPVINIAKVITDKEIEKTRLFFERCAQDYRQLGEQLIFQLANKLGVIIDIDSPMSTFHKFKNSKLQRVVMDDWEYFLHGIHCGFQHRKTRQILEVCLFFGAEFGDLDAFFFSRYIKSTPSYQPLPVEIYEEHADGIRIIERMLELGIFEKINKDDEHYPGVVATNKVAGIQSIRWSNSSDNKSDI